MKRLSEVDYIEDENGCWIWQLGKSGGGYGVKWDRVRRKQMGAHRWYYEQANGEIPDGMCIDHLCRVRACVNPDHLEAVTNSANLGRGPRVAGDECKRGHKRTEENTYFTPDGRRRCRVCTRSYMSEYHQRRKAVY